MKYNDPNRRPECIRNTATNLSTAAPLGDHCQNDDEIAPYLFSFTKGLGHELNGLLSDTTDFEQFAKGTQNHAPEIFAETIPYRGDFPGADVSGLTKKADHYNRWESPTAGHAYVLEGPDPFAVTMPPAPDVGSAEFGAEIAEVYQMALSRDWAVAAFMDDGLVKGLTNPDGTPVSAACKKRISDDNKRVADSAKRLSEMPLVHGRSRRQSKAIDKRPASPWQNPHGRQCISRRG